MLKATLQVLQQEGCEVCQGANAPVHRSWCTVIRLGAHQTTQRVHGMAHLQHD